MKDRYGIDTNILIYYFTGKPEKKYKKCLKLIKRAEKGEITLEIVPLVFWEATWVLEEYFKNSRQKIADILKMFLRLEGIECKDKEILNASFNLWVKEDIDFADAYIVKHYNKLKVEGIYLYDQHMEDKDIKCLKPEGKL